MGMIKRSKENVINGTLIIGCITEHSAEQARLERLNNYYTGNHDILARKPIGEFAPNNRLVCNFPKYITDTVCGYMFGNSISLRPSKTADISAMQSLFARLDIDTHNAEMGKDLSVFGKGFELLYLNETGQPKIALIDPRNAFVVYNDSLDEQPLFGVCYHKKIGADGKQSGYRVYVYTDSEVDEYITSDLQSGDSLVLERAEPHMFGGVPLINFWNNEEGQGDYEPVISLIDAYNVLESDRVNDKERFVDAILLIRNATLPDESSKAAELLKQGILELPGQDADANYLTKTLNETEVEVLKKALVYDIHKISQTPDFCDEQFSGNTSGVAIKYKLLSLEYLAKTKERFFIAGLRERLRMLANILSAKGYADIDLETIEITFNRTLPINEPETAQTLATLLNSQAVSQETAIGKLGFVKDVEEEQQKIAQDRHDRIKATADAMAGGDADSVRL